MKRELILNNNNNKKKLKMNKKPTDALGQNDDAGNGEYCFSTEPSLEKLRQLQEQFASDRNWHQYHTPRNLLLALVGEVGELAEIFQWKGEVQKGLPDFSDAEKHHVAQEMGDVLLYLVRLADACNIDLPTAALEKISHNAKNYPVEKAYGRSCKHTAYHNETEANGTGDS